MVKFTLSIDTSILFKIYPSLINTKCENKDTNDINLNTTDGIRLNYDDKVWVLLPSFSKENGNKNKIECWWCKHSFSNKPLGIPLCENEEGYITDGCFCSIECIITYIHSTRDIKYKNSIELINKIFIENYNKDIEEMNIIPAHDWKLLEKFGGFLTINEFRSEMKKQFKEIVGNFIPSNILILEKMIK